jgi:hypothetical protein
VGGGAFHVGDRAVNALNQAFVDDTPPIRRACATRWPASAADGLRLQVAADNVGNARYYSAAGNGLLGVGLPRIVKAHSRGSASDGGAARPPDRGSGAPVAGLIVGALWALQGLTGALLVYGREADRVLNPIFVAERAGRGCRCRGWPPTAPAPNASL